ncbi:MAG: hypothetical protein H5U26_02090 [Immundisolibacter sp.]|nr:hypothetical protein [Immundisolibacter sp.]MBC7160886.1 hypothetical protein [Immundisolibacter sp.]
MRPNVGVQHLVKGLPQSMAPLHGAFIDNLFDKALQVANWQSDFAAMIFDQPPAVFLIK